jgi:uncharacterized membrane protein
MALFTMMMGNAFAAFPVMAAAIGLPLLIRNMAAIRRWSARSACWPVSAAR